MISKPRKRAPQGGAAPAVTATHSLTERMFMDPAFFGVPASPVQRAICRAADGVPLAELWEDAAVRATFGGAQPPPGRPKMLIDIGPIRRGKSLFVAALALTRTQTVDVSAIGVGEAGPRIPIVSVDKDKAAVVYQHLTGKIGASRLLGEWRLGEPTRESVLVRHPSGIGIEICTVAGAKSGSTLVARWVVCAIFDEATLMLGQDDSVIALEDMLTQLEGRVLPGGQTVLLGSSIAPPRGPAYELLHRYFGRPGDGVVACWSVGPEARPDLYTPEHCATLSPSVRRATCERVFLDLETDYLSGEVLERATRSAPRELEADPDVTYIMAVDPSARKNSWTMVVIGAYTDRWRVALAREWVPEPGEKLNYAAVLEEVATTCLAYRIDVVHSDQYQAEALSVLAEQRGLGWNAVHLQGTALRDAYLELARLLAEGELELPPVPELMRDLQSVRRQTTQAGDVKFVLGKSGARHCDYASALARGCMELPAPPLAKAPTRSLDDEMDAMTEPEERGGTGIEAALRKVIAA